ncbi:MAG: hypothetical protein ACM3NS_08500 [Deltaproteobacteria bacterium]
MELDGFAPEIAERLDRLNGVQVVLAMPGVTTGEGLRQAVANVRDGMAGLVPTEAVVLVHPDGVMADTAAPDPGPALLPFPITPVDRLPAAGQEPGTRLRMILAASNYLHARACAVVGSEPSAIGPQALRGLVQPVLEDSVDLVTPCYLRHRFEGLLLSSVVAPLIRALYGRRIRFPLGADYGFSSRLMERLAKPAARDAMPIWLTTDTICAGYQVAQVQLGLPMPAVKEPPDVSTAVAQVLGPVFGDIERNAACWQKIRGSQAAVTFGTAPPPPEGPSTVDVTHMVETFRLANRNLQDLWRTVLPPAILLELKRLTQLAPEEFRFPDEVWARTIYDFALAYRLRVMSRDHLLGALTPLYLAWVAGYAGEVGAMSPGAVEQRLDRLGAAFEAQKPYLVSRWRWPDRF